MDLKLFRIKLQQLGRISKGQKNDECLEKLYYLNINER